MLTNDLLDFSPQNFFPNVAEIIRGHPQRKLLR
jgi:hypothetical protein